MSKEEYARGELDNMLDELEQCQLYCNRERLRELVFSPERNVTAPWTERLQQLISGELAADLGFRSNTSREKEHALYLLAGYTGQEATEHLATVIVWNDAEYSDDLI